MTHASTLGLWTLSAVLGGCAGRPSVTGYEGRDSKAPWRAAAARRIEEIRKADLKVEVTGPTGAPVLSADVHVKMVKHAFGFGAAVSPDAFSESGRADASGDKYRQTFLKVFNKAVFNSGRMEWGPWENPKHRATDLSAATWLTAQGVAVRGHSLVSPRWDSVPSDVSGLRGDLNALRKRVADHVTDEATALKGQVTEWDVINEPGTRHDLMDVLGEDVMVDWFALAHQADPAITLYLNEFGLEFDTTAAESKRVAFEKQVAFLVGKGAPIGGVGLESHFASSAVPPEHLLALLDRLAKLGVAIEGTEYDGDFSNDPVYADYTRDYLTVFFSHPSVVGILTWDFWGSPDYVPGGALFHTDAKATPAGQAWMDLTLAQWTTDVQGPTAGDGTFQTRGFLGNYDITITALGQTRTVRATVSKPSSTVKVQLD